MRNRSILIGIGLVSLVGVGVWAQTPAQTPRASQPQCTLTGKGAFDLGWHEPTPTGSYRCMATYDPALKLSGAAWVKTNADGTVGPRLPQ